MKQSTHKVAGVYATKQNAQSAMQELRESGFEASRIQLVAKENLERLAASRGRIDKDSIRDLLTGGAAGAGVGAAGAAAFVAAEVSVFVAAPVAAVLAGAGAGALLGTVAGGVSSASLREPDFLALVKDALEHDGCVVVVDAESEARAIEAQDVIGRTAAEKTIDQYGAEQPKEGTKD